MALQKLDFIKVAPAHGVEVISSVHFGGTDGTTLSICDTTSPVAHREATAILPAT